MLIEKDCWANFLNFLHMNPCYDQIEKYHIFGPLPPHLHIISMKWSFLILKICHFLLKIWNLHKILDNLHISLIKIGQAVQEQRQTEDSEYRKNAQLMSLVSFT